MSFRNWAGTHGCSPARFHQPASDEEVAGIVRSASEGGRRVRVVGAGHSWNDIACTDEEMVSLDRLAGALSVEGDRVTVDAGMRLRELNRRLPEHGRAMANLGSIAEQAIAGALATGTHGTGLSFGNLASQVTGMRLVTADGRVVDAPSEELPLDAARIHLGCLGVVTQVTLRCVPAFRLIERTVALPFDRALADLDGLLAKHDHVKLWWLPHTDRVQVWSADRTDEPATPTTLAERIDRSWLARAVFALLLRVGRLLPGAVPFVNGLVAGAYFVPRRRIDRSDRVLNIPMPPVHRESEYAVDVARAAEAMEGVRRLIDREVLKVNFVVEARFVAADEGWLSPAYRRASCHLGAYIYEGGSRARYFEAFEEMMLGMEGRPHWGKEFAARGEVLRRAFPRLDDFDALRRRLDPRGTFENDYVRRVFARGSSERSLASPSA